MKFITVVVAFLVTFGFAVFLTTLLGANNRSQFPAIENNSTAREISAFIKQDVENGYEMDMAALSGASLFEYSEAVSAYVTVAEAAEDVNFPPDFRFAWQAHMSAWHKHADFLENRTSGKDFYEKEIYRNYSNQREEIKRTWLEVLDISKKYGAVIPQNAY